MKKVLSFFILCALFISVAAQRDTEHWFAPMIERTSIATTSQRIYLSTDSVTPFVVTISNNNTPIATVTISKGSPQFYDVAKALIVTSVASEAFNPNCTMGIYVNGSKPFYARLGLAASTTHAEQVTSKGKAGLGTKFYSVNTQMYYNSTIANFMTSIMATEDNTTVTVSGYKSVTNFTNGWNGVTTPTITFTLNKGKSYIIEGQNTAGNFDGFIGAKIVSSKPVSVTNGNYNGNYTTTGSYGGSDIIMDQSVPTDRLGQEFGLIKGNANIGTSMEGALVVATENGTQIFVNNETVPLATLNEGQYYRVVDSKYILQAAGHYNLYIKATKNVYVYQLLGGSPTDNATEGFNYIPPLSCYLPRKIDEIGNINAVGNTAALSAIPTKLNIVTEAGGVVTATSGGVAIASLIGPYPLTGAPNWETYSATNVTGTVVVTSTKAVTAGITAATGTAGYGGYFAGFSSIPVIAKQIGECIPGIILEVDDSFDSYQWFLNGAPITIGGNANTFTPTIAGDYTCTVTVGTCPPLTTPIYKVFTCLQVTTGTLLTCATSVITPTFTTSTQTVVPGTVTIITAPTNGTATVNATTGAITYIPNAGFTGTDTITYKFCGNAPIFVDCEKKTLTITVVPFLVSDVTIKACNVNGQGIYNLNNAPVTTSAPVVKKFYPTLANLLAGTSEITNPNAYVSSVPNSVYVKVTTPEGCSGNAKITFDFFPTPIVYDASLTTCFIEGNILMGTFDLTSANVTTQTPVTKKYFPSLADANAETNQILPPTGYLASNGFIYVKVFNSDGCSAIAKVQLKVTPPTYSPLLVDQYICIDAKTTLNAGPGFDSYQWSTGATTANIINVSVGSYWVILFKNGCPTKQFVNVIAAANPVITSIEVSNNDVTIMASGGTPPYKYSSNNISWQISNQFFNAPRGLNTFYVKDAKDCLPVSEEVTILNLVNAITPNGDGINDVLDYSALAYKENLTFTVFDRYGKKIFSGDRSNGLLWNGRFEDRKIYTGTYWYNITWNESDAQKTFVKYSGWVLVKNRE